MNVNEHLTGKKSCLLGRHRKHHDLRLGLSISFGLLNLPGRFADTSAIWRVSLCEFECINFGGIGGRLRDATESLVFCRFHRSSLHS